MSEKLFPILKRPFPVDRLFQPCRGCSSKKAAKSISTISSNNSSNTAFALLRGAPLPPRYNTMPARSDERTHSTRQSAQTHPQPQPRRRWRKAKLARSLRDIGRDKILIKSITDKTETCLPRFHRHHHSLFITPRFAECDWTDTRILLPTTYLPLLDDGCWLVGWPTFLNLAENGSLCHFARKSVRGATVESRGGSKEPPKNCWKLHLYETMVSENVSTFCALKFLGASGQRGSRQVLVWSRRGQTGRLHRAHRNTKRGIVSLL